MVAGTTNFYTRDEGGKKKKRMTDSKGHVHSGVKGSGEQLRTEKRSVACLTRVSLKAMSITEHHHGWSRLGD